jgi:hypothetical protein
MSKEGAGAGEAELIREWSDFGNILRSLAPSAAFRWAAS